MAVKAPPRLKFKEAQIEMVKRALGDVIAISYDPKDIKPQKKN